MHVRELSFWVTSRNRSAKYIQWMHYLSLTRNIIFQNVDRGFLDQQTKKKLSVCRIQKWGFRFCLLVLWRLGFSTGRGASPSGPIGSGFFWVFDAIQNSWHRQTFWEDLSDANLVSRWTFLDVTNHSHILPNEIAESCWKLKLSHPKSP